MPSGAIRNEWNMYHDGTLPAKSPAEDGYHPVYTDGIAPSSLTKDRGPADRESYRKAARRARLVHPGPVGEFLAHELEWAISSGTALGPAPSLMEQVRDDILRAVIPD